MTVTVMLEGFVCQDCACVIANADSSGIDNYQEWAEGVWNTNAAQDEWNPVIACGGDSAPDHNCDEKIDGNCTHCGRNVYSTFHPVVYFDK